MGLLIPVTGCAVTWQERPAVVHDPARPLPGAMLEIELIDAREPHTRLKTVRVETLRHGLARGMVVQDVPKSRTRSSLGTGEVQALRRLGGRTQALVQLHRDGRCLWFPWQHLRRLGSTLERVARDRAPRRGHAERFRLKLLAHALQRWNENTGALGALSVDPLPHQIQLVADILRSGELNWLIADDVGLGKTIEVGMLLSALRQRRGFERILVVTPAGLVQQWQEELSSRFQQRDFLIWGRDFEVLQPEHWALHPRVIVSMDRAKHERHLPNLLAASDWDLVVFDEAHRLTRRLDGARYKLSERFALARALRSRADNFLLLTATPHQGRTDRFQALLELLRPDLIEPISRLEVDASFLADMVYRNRKADVTDAEGRFIFRGKDTHAIEVPINAAERAFDKQLQRYIRDGYAAADTQGGVGRAIGFVMTVFRKLAASSIAAIVASLERRRLRLLEAAALAEALTAGGGDSPDGAVVSDARYEGEAQERRAQCEASAQPFFANERDQLERLLEAGRALVPQDSKLAAFLDRLVAPICTAEVGRKLLIFTEYRGTLAHIERALRARYGEQAVVLIHGGMSLDERRDSMRRFDDQAQFLVSTEAGGEGLNLHRRCFTLVNYDLPWNPMRLVQRIGRLYRYGQTRRVVVFNLRSQGTLDDRVVQSMYDRLDRIAVELATVSDEFDAGYRDEVFGSLATLADVQSILESAPRDIQRTEERIADALQRAQDSQRLQESLLSEARHYDPRASTAELQITLDHAHAFVRGMLRPLGCELRDTSYQGQVLEVRLSDTIRAALHRKAARCRLTTCRDLADRVENIEMMDATHPLMQHMLARAQSADFGGGYARVGGLPNTALLTAAWLRWQNDQGMPVRDELLTLSVPRSGPVRVNEPAVVRWLPGA